MSGPRSNPVQVQIVIDRMRTELQHHMLEYDGTITTALVDTIDKVLSNFDFNAYVSEQAEKELRSIAAEMVRSATTAIMYDPKLQRMQKEVVARAIEYVTSAEDRESVRTLARQVRDIPHLITFLERNSPYAATAVELWMEDGCPTDPSDWDRYWDRKRQ